MAWKYIGNINKDIQYICESSDIKCKGDLGSRLYIYDTGQHYINVDGEDTWELYVPPVSPSSDE